MKNNKIDKETFGIHANLTKSELEIGYDARATVEDFMEFINQGKEISDEAYKNYSCMKDVIYGDLPSSTMDIFPAEKNSPILIVIHGGYWRALNKEQHAFTVPLFNQHNVCSITVEYGLAPKTKVAEMVTQIRQAVSWAYHNAEEFNGDKNKIFAIGSSAGAHLAAMLLQSGWHEEHNVPENIIKGVTLQSGLYDLSPLIDCEPNQWLNMDNDQAKQSSFIGNKLISEDIEINVIYAEEDTDEFKLQSIEAANYIRQNNLNCEVKEIKATNHYDLFLHFSDKNKDITEQFINQIKGIQLHNSLGND